MIIYKKKKKTNVIGFAHFMSLSVIIKSLSLCQDDFLLLDQTLIIFFLQTDIDSEFLL